MIIVFRAHQQQYPLGTQSLVLRYGHMSQGKAPTPPVTTALPHNLHFHVTVGALKSF